ncbi:MAG: sigma-70 family RNA polymerase sigma factor [Pirellulales bacterium]
MPDMVNATEPSETLRLVQRAAAGDDDAWERLMSEHRVRLRRVVAARLDRRLQGRVDPSDVLQESYIDAARRLADYALKPPMPFFLWLRFLASQRLAEQHRRHLGAKARDAGREASLFRDAFSETTTADLAAHLLGKFSSPSQAAIRFEEKIRLHKALDGLEPLDREILVLRHFEQLTNGEAANVLGVDKPAASKRYTRALVRLKDLLISLRGGYEELLP